MRIFEEVVGDIKRQGFVEPRGASEIRLEGLGVSEWLDGGELSGSICPYNALFTHEKGVLTYISHAWKKN